jgi:hypothetical protein
MNVNMHMNINMKMDSTNTGQDYRTWDYWTLICFKAIGHGNYDYRTGISSQFERLPLSVTKEINKSEKWTVEVQYSSTMIVHFAE